MTLIDLRTKQCLYCAETIQAEAIKCRFCGEFLNTDQANEGEPKTEDLLFETHPSLWSIAGPAIKGVVVFTLAVFLIVSKVELLVKDLLKLELTEEQLIAFAQYRLIGGVGLAVIVVLILVLKIVRVKMIYYKVTKDRVEWSRGILDRRVDNIDMFRVVDLSLQRSLFDCIFGIGTVTLITTDKTDPEFAFEKIKQPRKLYDIIKKTSLEADSAQRVIHLE